MLYFCSLASNAVCFKSTVLVESLLSSQTVHKTPIMNQKSLSSWRRFLCVNLIISSFIRICAIGQPSKPVLPYLWHKENLGHYLRAVPSQACVHGFLQARAVGCKFKSNVLPQRHSHKAITASSVLCFWVTSYYVITQWLLSTAQAGPEFHNYSASGSWVTGIAGSHHKAQLSETLFKEIKFLNAFWDKV